MSTDAEYSPEEGALAEGILIDASPGEALPGQRSLRYNAAWNSVGTISYAASQWLTVLIIARMTTPTALGQYAMALALCTPVFLLGCLSLRSVWVSRTCPNPIQDYLFFRLLSVFVCALTVAALALLMGLGSMAPIVSLVALSKANESIADILYAVSQREERLDLCGRSLLLRAIGSVLAMFAGIAIFKSVFFGLILVNVATTLVLVAYDIPRTRALLRVETVSRVLITPSGGQAIARLLKHSYPLGVAMMLISLTFNVPRYFVEHFQGAYSVGILTSMLHVALAGSVLMTGLTQPGSARLSLYFHQSRKADFRHLTYKLLFVTSIFGLAFVTVCFGFGHTILGMVYGKDYAQFSQSLFLVAVAGAFTYLTGVLGNALTAAGFFVSQIWVYLVVITGSALACWFLVPRYQVEGAAGGLLAGAVLGLGGMVCLFRSVLGRFAEKPSSAA